MLPARFPNLLVNGASGIAVGMATNIPPHNLGETIDAVVHYLDEPESTTADLMKFIKGPDFPTGAVIMGRQGIKDAYETGRGSIKVRAVTTIEEGSQGRSNIVVTELPYQVNKARLAEKVADLVKTGKVKDIVDVRDESSRQGMRLVIVVKRGGNASVVLNQLYKHTQLQDNFGVIMLSLVDGVPRTLTLAEMIAARWASRFSSTSSRRGGSSCKPRCRLPIKRPESNSGMSSAYSRPCSDLSISNMRESVASINATSGSRSYNSCMGKTSFSTRRLCP